MSIIFPFLHLDWVLFALFIVVGGGWARRSGFILTGSLRNLIFGVGLIGIIGGVALLGIATLFLSARAKTMGTVLYSAPQQGYTASFSPGRRSSYKSRYKRIYWDVPRIAFSIEGTTYTFDAAGTWRGHYVNGQSIPVYYDSKNPEHARIRNDLITWPLDLIGFGLLMLLLTVLIPDYS